MALYRQLKFPSTFIEYRSVSEWKGVVVISNFDSLEEVPSKSTALGSCLVCPGLNSPLRFLSHFHARGILVASEDCSSGVFVGRVHLLVSFKC